MGNIKNNGRIQDGYYYDTKENCIVTISNDDGCVLLTRQNEEEPYKQISSTEEFSLKQENLREVSTTKSFNQGNYTHFN